MIYVMGANGFVGSGICNFLKDKKIEFEALTRDNYSQLKGTECDIFINANGNSKKNLANHEPIQDLDLSFRSVASSIYDFRYKKYVFLSSCDVYENTSETHLNTELSDIDHTKISRYGLHKLFAEQYVKATCSSWLVLRLAGMVGPGLRKNPIYDILMGQKIWLDPRSLMQFMQTRDVASTVLGLISSHENQIFNICGTGTVCLQDVIDEFHPTGRPEIVENSPKIRYEISTRKLEDFGFKPRSSKDAVFDFCSQVKAGAVTLQ